MGGTGWREGRGELAGGRGGEWLAEREWGNWLKGGERGEELAGGRGGEWLAERG